MRRISRHADLVYVADALRVPGAPGRVVAMPAELASAPRREDERHAARRALGLPSQSPPGSPGRPLVAVFLGRMVRDKGLDVLLDALPEGVLLLVAGDGPERARLQAHQALQTGRARFVGPVFGAAKRQLLDAADLLVVPSRRDGAPTVVAEARARGVPILACAVGGLPEAVGRAGWLIEPSRAALRHALSERVKLGCDGLPPTAASNWSEVGLQLWGAIGGQYLSSKINIMRY